MSSAFQNRLVGTIIVVALAVIFLPDILDGKKQTDQDMFVEVPTPPEMRPVSEAESFPQERVRQQAERKAEVVPDVATDDFDLDDQVENELLTDANEAESNATEQQANGIETDTANSPATVAAENTVQDRAIEDIPVETAADNLPAPVDTPNSLLEEAGWVVQLGVFRHQKNVRELLNKLKNAGYRAFSRPVQTSTGELTKVFVGPELNKDELENALPHLRDLTRLQGRITPFTVK